MPLLVEQLPFEFRLDDAVVEHQERVHRALRTAIEDAGLKWSAGQCDASPSAMCDALARRDRKPFHLEWLVTLLVTLPAAARLALLTELADAAGYAVAEPKPLTDAQKLAALEESIREEFGPAGERVIAKHRRARGKR